MGGEHPEPGREPGRTARPGGRAARDGSRLLLAAALVLGVAAALYAGARLAEAVCDLAGISSLTIRLFIKVLLIAASLPAGFYLVERLFLGRFRGR